MADSKSSIGGTGQPITRHPLFPAIVALWCGALAGLGSVTIGSSTVEGLVQMLGIDKVIPMAAPPLGTTMRILLALAMTGLGAAIGGVLARRIAGSAGAEATSEQIEGEVAEAAVPVEAAPGARRRRALAIEPEAAAPAYDERAPLPGATAQGEAQILNVADFDLDTFDDAPAPAPFRRAFTTVEETRTAPVAKAPVEDADEDDNLPAWLEAESAWVEADSTAGQRGVFTTPPGAQVFQPQPAPSDAAVEDDADSQLGNRLFEAYSRELSPRSETPAGIQPAEDAAPGFEIRFNAAQASQNQTGQNQSGFNQPGFKLLPRLPQGDWSAHNDVADPAEAVIENEWCEDAALENADTFAAPAAEADYIAETQPETAPEIVNAWAAPAEEIASQHADSTFEEARAEARSAADRIADAELEHLSPVELLERLAVAMQRRRDAAREEAARLEAARLEAAQAEAEQEEARRAAEAAAAAPVTAPFAAPVVEQAFDDDHGHADYGFVETTLPDAPAEPTWPSAVPSALRPVELEPIDADDQPLPGYLPPRHIALAPLQGDAPEAGFTPNAAFEAIPFPSSPFSGAEVEDDEEAEDDVVLQQGYSSLLNLSRHSAVRKPFLQFGEPDEAGDEEAHATPVLPTAYGEENSIEPAPFGRPMLAPAPQEGLSDPAPMAEERAFDAPGRNDPEATERALRAALATLQRMSGAA
ncbi:hypothetical protein [Novosphingobium kaempferiae]|uniref:hypothetical protein n=1 Tax=Novosphingobium kaempferiae TaxID=2896849 RepID=UPI001E31A538|nr:hypothetical protein [Novosphingobium kaempferiae]